MKEPEFEGDLYRKLRKTIADSFEMSKEELDRFMLDSTL